MIVEGLVNARLDMQNNTVEFTESETAGRFQSNPETIRLIGTLEQQNQRIIALMQKSSKLDRNIQLSEDFMTVKINKELSESRQDVNNDMNF
jgi:hypothetical protein